MVAMVGLMLTAMSLPAPLPPREQTFLKRVGKWNVDYDKDACHLIGQFGAGPDRIIARFTRFEPGDYFDLTLFGDRALLSDVQFNATLDFGTGAPIRAKGVAGQAGKLPMLAISSLRLDGKSGPSAPGVIPALEAKATRFTVTIPGKRQFRLDGGALDKPVAALRTCTRDLVKSWGFDPDQQAQLSRPVKPTDSPSRWLRSADYPGGALMSGVNGVVQFRLDVDPQGGVAACHILYRTNPDSFADLTCAALKKRARFQPALDRNGAPVRSYLVRKVTWLIG